MKIQADEEGRKLLVDICDAALKAGGIGAFNAVSLVLNQIQKQPEKPDDTVECEKS